MFNPFGVRHLFCLPVSQGGAALTLGCVVQPLKEDLRKLCRWVAAESGSLLYRQGQQALPSNRCSESQIIHQRIEA